MQYTYKTLRVVALKVYTRLFIISGIWYNFYDLLEKKRRLLYRYIAAGRAVV